MVRTSLATIVDAAEVHDNGVVESRQEGDFTGQVDSTSVLKTEAGSVGSAWR